MASVIALTPLSASAEENLWVYTKGTDTRPQGSLELKLSNIMRIGKNSGDYVFNDIRPEVEYGITDRLTIGAEIMIFDHDYQVGDPNLNPMYETQQAIGTDGRVQKTQFAGYEINMKYNFLSPYKDVMGLTMGLGYEKRTKYRLDGADISQHSIVHTLLAQKNFLDDLLVVAFNWKTEFERRRSPGVLENELAFDVSAGASYRIAPKHFIGFEIRHQSDYLSPYNTVEGKYDDPNLDPTDFTSLKIGSQHQNGIYMGPTYHYAEEKWHFTAGMLMQVYGGGSEHAYVKNNKNWDEHERFHFGTYFGYNF